jgi:Ca-activated chloride channel family protein
MAAAPAKKRAASTMAGVLGRAIDKVAGAFARDRGDDVGESAPDGELLADRVEHMLESPAPEQAAADPVTALLERQLASGLWPGATDRDADRVRATARALLTLLDAGVTTTHPLHGAQIKKAVAALIALAPSLASTDTAAAELALGVAWLAASGRRTRREIESALASAPPLAALRPRLSDERTLRTELERSLS